MDSSFLRTVSGHAEEGAVLMLNFALLESGRAELKHKFHNTSPFEHLVIDHICERTDELEKAVLRLPSPEATNAGKSRDFIFAKNKYESSSFGVFDEVFDELKADLLSSQFRDFLSYLIDDDCFVDPTFYGGGLHQGGKSSYLNMHADFNYHPQQPSWFRNLNILIYLNPGWSPEYGGELKLKDSRDPEGPTKRIEPLFNRMVIMYTRDHTLHGYDRINFPDGHYRRSIASYAYTVQTLHDRPRTTVWYSENPILNFFGKSMPMLLRVKHRFFRSRTDQN